VERGNLSSLMIREKFKWKPHKNQSTEARNRDGIARSSEETSVMEVERRGLYYSADID
jgi:RNA-directed DNA polymerase